MVTEGRTHSGRQPPPEPTITVSTETPDEFGYSVRDGILIGPAVPSTALDDETTPARKSS